MRKSGAKLQEQLSNMGLELEKALKYRAALDLLEPTLAAMNDRLEALAHTQNSLSQTMVQWVRSKSEAHQNGGLLDAIRRILKPERKSSSPVR